MPCRPFEGDGVRGIVCTRERRQKCACGGPGHWICDGCDRPICGHHRTMVGEEDRCPECLPGAHVRLNLGTFRLLVTGGRRYDRADVVDEVLRRAWSRADDLDLTLTIVHGACGVRRGEAWGPSDVVGLDGLAHRWALWHGVPVEPWPATYSGTVCHGPPRNAAMVLSRPRACLSFPGGRGTADCSTRALNARVRVGTINRHGELTWQPPKP